MTCLSIARRTKLPDALLNLLEGAVAHYCVIAFDRHGAAPFTATMAMRRRCR
jgi:hypothetical protein